MGELEHASELGITLGNKTLIPKAGMQSVTGLKATSNGDYVLQGTTSAQKPALILQEDLHVCLALIFGDVAKPIMPSLSLEPSRITPIKDSLDPYKRKVWNPEWLGHTHFGRTMMITDYIMGYIIGCPGTFSITETNEAERQRAIDLIEGIQKLGGRSGEGQLGRIMLHPQIMKFNTISRKGGLFKKDEFDINLQEGKIMIDGSYWSRNTNGQEDRSVALNDPTFKHGKAAKFVTDDYNDIAKLMPVFERNRQMMILLHLMLELRNQGWKPSKKIQQKATSTLKRFEALPKLSKHELQCR